MLLELAVLIALKVLEELSDDDYGLGDVEWSVELMDLVKRARSHSMLHNMSPAEYCSVLRVLWYFWDLGGGTDDHVDIEDEDEDENKEPSVTMLDLFRHWFDDSSHDNLMPVIIPACALADGLNGFAPLPEGSGPPPTALLPDFHGQGCPGLPPMAAIVLMIEILRLEDDIFMEQGDLVDFLLQLARALINHIDRDGTRFGGDSGAPAPVARAAAAVAASAAAAASDDSSGKPQDPRRLAVEARASAKRPAESPLDDEPPASKRRPHEYVVGFNSALGTVKLRSKLPGGPFVVREVEIPSDMARGLAEGAFWPCEDWTTDREYIVGFNYVPFRTVQLQSKRSDGTFQHREVPYPAAMFEEILEAAGVWNHRLEQRAAHLLSGKP